VVGYGRTARSTDDQQLGGQMALPGGGSYSRASEGPGGWLERCQHAAAEAGPGNGSGIMTRTRGCAGCPYAACWGLLGRGWLWCSAMVATQGWACAKWRGAKESKQARWDGSCLGSACDECNLHVLP
jgi:hypothetical protein